MILLGEIGVVGVERGFPVREEVGGVEGGFAVREESFYRTRVIRFLEGIVLFKGTELISEFLVKEKWDWNWCLNVWVLEWYGPKSNDFVFGQWIWIIFLKCLLISGRLHLENWVSRSAKCFSFRFWKVGWIEADFD